MFALYEVAVDQPGRAPLFWMFVAMLVTFLGARVVTRRIRAGPTRMKNWNLGGVHVHHQVFGVIFMIVAGCLEFAYRPPSPGSEALGALFGAGVSLTLDEFALWLHLDDVYWTPEGRKSIDAVFVAIAVSGLLLVGAVPLDLAGTVGEALATMAATIALNLLFCLVAILKGKPVMGILGLLVPMVALVATVRLAKPTSPWARWRYKPGSRRLARSSQRFGPRYEARWNRLRDLIGGTPSLADRH